MQMPTAVMMVTEKRIINRGSVEQSPPNTYGGEGKEKERGRERERRKRGEGERGREKPGDFFKVSDLST